MSEVTIKQVPKVQILCRSYTGLYSDAQQHLDELYQWIMRKGYAIAGPGIGLFFDDPTQVEVDKCRYEVCYPVAETCEAAGDVKKKVMEPQEAAATEHHGSLAHIMAEAYATVFTWIGQNGYVYEAGEPIREIYLKSPLDVTVQSDLVTEVQIPVRKA